jgi:hypothetical protein
LPVEITFLHLLENWDFDRQLLVGSYIFGQFCLKSYKKDVAQKLKP